MAAPPHPLTCRPSRTHRMYSEQRPEAADLPSFNEMPGSDLAPI